MGALEGYGSYIFENGDKYEGNWKDNMRDGHGVYLFNDGDKFEGNFKSLSIILIIFKELGSEI